MKNLIKIILAILFFTAQNAFSAHIYPEKFYQNEWCSKWGGKQEFRLADSTRIDCLTKTYATEFDFAPKWAEAIGQSLHYARMTGKKPAIVLIIEKSEDFKYFNKIKPLCENYNIALWYMEAPKDAFQAKNTAESPDFLEEILFFFIKYVKELIALVL